MVKDLLVTTYLNKKQINFFKKHKELNRTRIIQLCLNYYMEDYERQSTIPNKQQD